MQRKGKIHWTDRQGISFFSSTVEEVWSLSNASLSLSLSLSKSLHLLLSFFPFQVPTFPQQNEAIPTSSKDILFSSFHSFSLPLLRSQKKRTKCGKNSPVNHPLENLSKFLKLIYNMPMRCKAYNFIHSLTPMLILIFYQ